MAATRPADDIRAVRTETKGTLAIIGSSLGYGTLAVLAKLTLERGVGVVPLLMWRFVIAGIVLWTIVLAGRLALPTRGKLRGLCLLGGLYAANSLAFMIGLDRIPASLASLVFFTYPVVTVLLARLWIGEELTGRRLGALAAATAGCVLTVGQGVAAGDGAGVLWVLLAVTLLAGFIVASHGILARVPALGGTAVLVTTTAFALTIAALVSGGPGLPDDLRTTGLLVALGVVATAIPITLFLLGIQWIGPARAAIFSTLEPIITVGLASVVLNEILTPVQGIGGALILAGVVWLRLERVSLVT
jgi:drug/metabolite transporter (DMT)-like permease